MRKFDMILEQYKLLNLISTNPQDKELLEARLFTLWYGVQKRAVASIDDPLKRNIVLGSCNGY